jgi:hypothetical protein
MLVAITVALCSVHVRFSTRAAHHSYHADTALLLLWLLLLCTTAESELVT